MLNALVRFSLRFRGIVIALACALLAYGLYSLSRAKYDVFPEFASPQVVVQTSAPGLSPEQVETLITQSVENALNGVDGIQAMRSNSIQGLSVVTIIFPPSSDIYRDRQAISERLTTLVGKLPLGASTPLMVPLTSSTGDLMTIGIASEKHSLMELRTLADWTIKQRLLAVPGVAKVAVFGGEVRQFQIQVSPEKLIQYNLSVDDVLNAARRATGVKGAGFIDTENQRIIFQTEGQLLTAENLAQSAVVIGNNANVTANLKLGDIASVVEAPEPRISAAGIMGKPGVILNVWGQYGANTLETTRDIERAIGELRPALESQDIILYPDLFRAANFIETATHNLKGSLFLGAFLVIAVLFFFLANIRSASISVVAIPLSLLAAVTALQVFGFSLNTMTLGGLAIAIGEVVDDAVIDVENILRRLKENRLLQQPKPVFQVVLDASIEVRSAVVYATFAVVLVFIPVLTMSGLSGRLFAPLGAAYILAILFSLAVALTVTPALCFFLLNARGLKERESGVVHWLKEKYRPLLLKVEKNPKPVLAGIALMTFAGMMAFPFLRGEFLPELKEGHFVVHMTAAPGTSLAESLRIGNLVSRDLLEIPYVRSVAQRIGRAEADDTFGTHASEFEVDLKPLSDKQAESAQSDIRSRLEKFPGVRIAVNTFLTERIEETLSGFTAPVGVSLFGNDLDALDRKVGDLVKVLETIRGVRDIQVQSPAGTPQLSIRLRQKDMAKWGLDSTDVLDGIGTAYQGHIVGQIYQGNRVFDVSVILHEKNRSSITDVGSLPFRSPGGAYVSLKQIADISQVSGRYGILHHGARRVQTVTCNVEGRDIGSFVAEVKKRLNASLALPPGTYLEFSGTAEAEARSKRDLMAHSLLAGFGIILLLFVVLRNYRNVILVLMNLPFAFAGGLIAVFFSEGLSIGSMVGFVTLFGITLRNSIMMISHYEHLVSEEGMSWGLETAIRGASERLTPILMTALVTALGLLPLAMGSSAPGREIEGPMAMVILGGLVTSTALNLLVLPTLALRYGRFQKKEKDV